MPSSNSQGTPVRSPTSGGSQNDHDTSAPASITGSSPCPTHIIKSSIRASSSRKRKSGDGDMDNSTLSDETTLVATPPGTKTSTEDKDAQLMEPEGGYPLVCSICHVTPSNMRSHVISAPHMSRIVALRSHYRTNPVVTAKMDKFITWCIEERLPIPEEIADLVTNGAAITTPSRPKMRRDGFANSNEYVAEQARRFSMADPFRGMYTETADRRTHTSTHQVPITNAYQPNLQSTHRGCEMPPQGFVEEETDEVPIKIEGGLDLNDHLFADEGEITMQVVVKNKQVDDSMMNIVDYEHGSTLPAPVPTYKVQKSAARFDSKGMVSATLMMTGGGFCTYGTCRNREPPQLKGLSLSGMGIFDAATPIQRRFRNQRKDASRVNEFYNRSKLVETIEKVYDSKFNFQRDRDVYDPPSPATTPEPEDFSTGSKTPTKQPKKGKAQEAPESPSAALIRLSQVEGDLGMSGDGICDQIDSVVRQTIYMGHDDETMMSGPKSSPYLSGMVLQSPQRSMSQGVLPPLFSTNSTYGYSSNANDQAMMNSLTIGRSVSYASQLHTSTQYGPYTYDGGPMMSSYPPVTSATSGSYGSGSGMAGFNYATGGSGSGSGSGSNGESSLKDKETDMSYLSNFSSYGYNYGSPKMGNNSRPL